MCFAVQCGSVWLCVVWRRQAGGSGQTWMMVAPELAAADRMERDGLGSRAAAGLRPPSETLLTLTQPLLLLLLTALKTLPLPSHKKETLEAPHPFLFLPS